MSQVFEGYERRFCELLANLSRTCTSFEEQKKQKFSEITGELDEAEALLRKMDLEARSMPSASKAMLLAKIREYRNNLDNLKSELKIIDSSSANEAARSKLLESGSSDTMQGSCDQRGRLMTSTERLNKSSDRIRESRRRMVETEEIGVSILQNLHQQRESLQHSNTSVHGLNNNIDKSKKILNAMSKRMN